MTINDLISVHGIEKLNSATKYPSILTYHALGEKGRLLPELNEDKHFRDEEVVLFSEKVDGTNTRIVFDMTGDFLVGSREDFVYAKGDRVLQMKHPIVRETLRRDLASVIGSLPKAGITVIFGEVYGPRVTAAKYAGSGFLLFDAFVLNESVLSMSIEAIASWRDNGGQKYLPASALDRFVALGNRVPELVMPPPPVGLVETLEYLEKYLPSSFIDNAEYPEGVVVRTPDRKLIRKLRFEDYERTLKIQKRKNHV